MLYPDPTRPTPLSPRPDAPVSRRRILTGAGRGVLAATLLGAATSASATACGKGAPHEPDPLEAQLAAARRDSDLAAAAAKGAPRPIVPALLVVANERSRHATALIEELARAAGKPTPTETAATTTPAAGQSTNPGPPPSLQDVMNALRDSADSATKLAPTLSGYRAGLTGSIAAACTASYTVGLVPLPGKAPR